MAGLARFREWSGARRSRLSPWLAVAVVVHAGLFAVSQAWTLLAAPERSPPSAPAALTPIEFDLITSPDEPSANAVAAREPPASEPLGTLEPSREEHGGAAGEGGSPGPSHAEARAPSVAAAARGASASGVREQSAVEGGVEMPGVDAAGVETAAPTVALAPGVSAGAARPDATVPGRRPGLSLRELGVDRSSNPFIGGPADLPTERQRLNQRLRQSLRGGIAKQDQRRGLGPEGPAVAAVKEIVLASATAPNTSALLRVRANGAGRVTHVEVLQADRDDDEWRRIAEQLVAALAGTTLRVPAKSRSVSFDLRVVSRVQLPSGADPGLAIDLFGVPVKKGDGERSTRLSLLSPVVQEVEVPHSNGARVPVVSFALIAGMGDLADIGAVARRLVTAYLVGMDTQSSPESSSDAPPPASASSAP